jgi:hypothetical protein
VLALLLAAVVYGDPVVAFTFADPRIDESSGLVSSSISDGVVFTHNDSGDEARFFAVDARGRTLTTYVLPGVQARDWEDLARGPDEQGRSSLWLGDIGDNNARRDNGILVHRVREPVPGTRQRVVTEPPTSFRLRYPDGPGDAEALVVHPTTGRLYVLSKPLAGASQVYEAPERLDPDRPNRLERIGEVTPRATGTEGGPGIGGLAQLLVTAADISPDGARLAVRTYTDVYEFDLPGGDLVAGLQTEPVVSPLPSTRQGEGLAYSRDGRSLLTSTEGRASPVYRLRAVAAPSDRATPGRQGSDRQRPVAQESDDRRGPLLGAAVLVLALVVVLVRLRRRRTYTPR